MRSAGSRIAILTGLVGLLARQVAWAFGSEVIAHGQVLPWYCREVSYQPTVRLCVAMGMLLFPIVFYAIYQCCFTGETYSKCCQHSKTSPSSSEVEVAKPFTGE